MYRYYLIAVVALSLISLGKFALSVPDLLEYVRQGDLPGFVQFRFFILRPVTDLAQIGLFLFAISSLKRIREPWVRTLHLSINGVAVIVSLLSYSRFIWNLEYWGLLLNVGHVATIQLHALVPWSLLNTLPGGMRTGISLAVNTGALVLAAVWSYCWSRSHDFVPGQMAAVIGSAKEKSIQDDLARPMSVGSWLITLILLCIPVLNIILALWWSFSPHTPINKANYAKATLILAAIIVLLYAIFVIAMIVSRSSYYY